MFRVRVNGYTFVCGVGGVGWGREGGAGLNRHVFIMFRVRVNGYTFFFLRELGGGGREFLELFLPALGLLQKELE